MPQWFDIDDQSPPVFARWTQTDNSPLDKGWTSLLQALKPAGGRDGTAPMHALSQHVSAGDVRSSSLTQSTVSAAYALAVPKTFLYQGSQIWTGSRAYQLVADCWCYVTIANINHTQR